MVRSRGYLTLFCLAIIATAFGAALSHFTIIGLLGLLALAAGILMMLASLIGMQESQIGVGIKTASIALKIVAVVLITYSYQQTAQILWDMAVLRSRGIAISVGEYAPVALTAIGSLAGAALGIIAAMRLTTALDWRQILLLPLIIFGGLIATAGFFILILWGGSALSA